MPKDYKYMPKSKEVKKVVIFLHGYGADGEDLISLADIYEKALPDTAFYSLNAPEPTPFNMGYQWFGDVNNYGLLEKEIDETLLDKNSIKNSAEVIKDYISKIADKHSLNYSDIAIIGFSQGSMIGLYTSIRLKEKLAGVVAFSGLLIDVKDLTKEDTTKLPILLYHGENDSVVNPQGSINTERTLSNLDFNDVELVLEKGLDHGISLAGIEKSTKFLKRILFS